MTSHDVIDIVSLITRRSFFNFSSTYYRAVSSVALKFLCLRLQNVLWDEFAACNNVHILLLQRHTFSSMIQNFHAILQLLGFCACLITIILKIAS